MISPIIMVSMENRNKEGVMDNFISGKKFKKMTVEEKNQYLNSLSKEDATIFMKRIGFEEGYSIAKRSTKQTSLLSYYELESKKDVIITTLLLLIIALMCLVILILIFPKKIVKYFALIFGFGMAFHMISTIYPALRKVWQHEKQQNKKN